MSRTGSVNSLVEDNWNPTAGLSDASGFSPTYQAAKSGGTHTTVQAAIDAAESAGGSDRVFISVSPETYLYEYENTGPGAAQ